MSIDTPEELAGLRAAGQVVAETIRQMRRRVRAGVTTAELDQAGAEILRRAGARSGPQLDYGFPGVNCISVNDEAVHGIPGRRRLRDGDLVKLDVTAELRGFYADACVSVPVGRARPSTVKLIAAGSEALRRALSVARAGTPISAVGGVIEDTVRSRGYAVCADLMGHGIGRRIHEAPDVPNFAAPWSTDHLTEGLVITIEPIVSAGSGEVVELNDGWTVATADGARASHVEHTIVITRGAPVILTA